MHRHKQLFSISRDDFRQLFIPRTFSCAVRRAFSFLYRVSFICSDLIKCVSGHFLSFFLFLFSHISLPSINISPKYSLVSLKSLLCLTLNSCVFIHSLRCWPWPAAWVGLSIAQMFVSAYKRNIKEKKSYLNNYNLVGIASNILDVLKNKQSRSQRDLLSCTVLKLVCINAEASTHADVSYYPCEHLPLS